mmetsp:Transcript_25959/g.38880  ORF Transcript_25959/g.38880 Transcript_25959/m.38880 type:complete len:240 (+) Transcript_25959:358-1077(+)
MTMTMTITTLAVIGTGLLYFLSYIGLFRKITFREETIGPFVFVYRTETRPYEQVGPVFQDILNFMKHHNDNANDDGNDDGNGNGNGNDSADCRMAGIYYDDPKKTSNPRSALGFLIETDKHKKTYNDILQQVNVNVKDKVKGGKDEQCEQEDDKCKREYEYEWEWEVMEVQETKTVSSYFPMRIPMISFPLSAIKTYGAFQRQKQYQIQCGCFEIYERDRIGTFFPQSNISQFQCQFQS